VEIGRNESVDRIVEYGRDGSFVEVG